MRNLNLVKIVEDIYAIVEKYKSKKDKPCKQALEYCM